MISEAIILAGGFGTRLKSVIQDLPKPMAPVNGRPFLAYLMQYLAGNGIDRVVISTGHLHEKITSFFGSSFHGITIIYSHEISPMGTGGGIRLAMEKCTTNEVLVLNGDSFFEINLKSFYRQFHLCNGNIALAVREIPDAARYGTLSLDDSGKITAFCEKDGLHQPGSINGGVYLIQRDFFLQQTPSNTPFSIEKDLFQVNNPLFKIYGFPFEGYFIDIGIPSDYEKAQNDFK